MANKAIKIQRICPQSFGSEVKKFSSAKSKYLVLILERISTDYSCSESALLQKLLN